MSFGADINLRRLQGGNFDECGLTVRALHTFVGEKKYSNTSTYVKKGDDCRGLCESGASLWYVEDKGIEICR